jgi:hypothetical protein
MDDELTLKCKIVPLGLDVIQQLLELKPVEIYPPVVSYFGSLKRRGAKLLLLLSFICRSLFRKNIWTNLEQKHKKISNYLTSLKNLMENILSTQMLKFF